MTTFRTPQAKAQGATQKLSLCARFLHVTWANRTHMLQALYEGAVAADTSTVERKRVARAEKVDRVWVK